MFSYVIGLQIGRLMARRTAVVIEPTAATARFQRKLTGLLAIARLMARRLASLSELACTQTVQSMHTV